MLGLKLIHVSEKVLYFLNTYSGKIVIDSIEHTRDIFVMCIFTFLSVTKYPKNDIMNVSKY